MSKNEAINEIVIGILDCLSSAAQHCHMCPDDAVEDMCSATQEIDVVVSALTGHPQADLPDGRQGVAVARFFLASSREKIQTFQVFTTTESELHTLEGVLASVSELRRGLPL